MIEDRADKYSTGKRGASGFAGFVMILGVLLAGCAGGIPSIPNSPEAVLQKADAYFARGKYFQASELYRAFLLRYPGDDRSDYAEFKLAESLFGSEEWGLAAVEYHILVTNYGYSDYVDDAYFKEAVCYYRQALKPPLDQTKRLEALEKFERFVTVFPQSALVPEAQNHIQMIHEKLAEKAFANARFYIKKRRWRSGMIYLDKVIESYPNNDYWAQALFHKGLILLRRGDTEGAIRAFSEVLTYPRDIGVKNEAQRELRRLRGSGAQ